MFINGAGNAVIKVDTTPGDHPVTSLGSMHVFISEPYQWYRGIETVSAYRAKQALTAVY